VQAHPQLEGRRGLDPDSQRQRGHHPPYLVRFSSGLSIAVFFYDGPPREPSLSRVLNSGESLAARLKGGFKDNAQPQLVHVATDGESYGHHHKYGEMALAYALRLLEEDRRSS